MIGNQENQEQFVAVSTKVPRHIADLLNIIAKARGVEVYQLLQWLIYAIIRMAKATTDLPDDLRTLATMLDMDAGWQHAMNLASPGAKTDIAQLVLILQQYDGTGPKARPRRGFGLAMINRPYMGDARVTYCVDDILERVTEVSMPGLYKQLRQVGIDLESESVRETLTRLCDAHTIQHLSDLDQAELPGLGEYNDFGQVATDYGNRAKRKHHYDPDTEANRQLRLFDPDRPYGQQADEYLASLEQRAKQEEQEYSNGQTRTDADSDEEPEDFRPHGVEW